MARAKRLTEEEKVKIKVLADAGISKRRIAEDIGRSDRVVRNFLKLGEKYGNRVPPRANTKLSRRQKIKFRSKQLKIDCMLRKLLLN